MWRAASWDCGLAEVVQRIAWGLLAVIRDPLCGVPVPAGAAEDCKLHIIFRFAEAAGSKASEASVIDCCLSSASRCVAAGFPETACSARTVSGRASRNSRELP